MVKCFNALEKMWCISMYITVMNFLDLCRITYIVFAKCSEGRIQRRFKW